MVALGILVLVTAAIYPQIVVGLRATGTARDITQAKGVAQAKLEQMRGMPFYVGREAGDYIDVLDTYYRNTTAPTVSPSCAASTLTDLPATTWTGYVPASSARCAWEPSGALYRKVINPVQSPGLGAFAMVISTQFLTGATPPTPIAARAGYNSQVAGSDAPPSTQIGVTIAVMYRTHSGVKYVTSYSQVERTSATDPLIESAAQATTVHVSSASQAWSMWKEGDEDPDGSTQNLTTLMANMGIVDLQGELFTGSRVIANATSAAGATSAPAVVTGASTNLTAPADSPATGAVAPDTQLPNGCTWICFGATRTDSVSAYASNGAPNSGSPDAPIRSYIPNGAGRYGFWFDNGKWRNPLQLANGQPMVSLDTSSAGSMPGVRNCAVGGSGATNQNNYLTATGFLTATPANSTAPEVSSCSTAQSNAIRIFPTTFAPNGVVRITLSRASAYCRVRAGSPNSADLDWEATVQYWNGSSYSTAGTIRPGNTTDPLAAVNMNMVIDGGSGRTLGDYISSWSSSTSDDIERTTGPKAVEASVPAVVRLITMPTRNFTKLFLNTSKVDPASAISVSVGALSCSAADYR